MEEGREKQNLASPAEGRVLCPILLFLKDVARVHAGHQATSSLIVSIPSLIFYGFMFCIYDSKRNVLFREIKLWTSSDEQLSNDLFFPRYFLALSKGKLFDVGGIRNPQCEIPQDWIFAQGYGNIFFRLPSNGRERERNHRKEFFVLSFSSPKWGAIGAPLSTED